MKNKRKLRALALCVIVSQISLQSIVQAQTTQAGRVDTETIVSSHRLAGKDRYETSIEIAKAGWVQADTVILASGEQFADALSAGPLAKKYNAPILLTSSESIGVDTLKEIASLHPKKIIIIGGNGAISSNVEDKIKAAGYADIDRIGGKDRFETSVMVAKRLGETHKAVIVSGKSYPDALSIAPIAAKLGMPILLTDKNVLSDEVKQYIESNSINQTYIVGGEGVLSPIIEQSVPSPIRLGGTDRYATNAVVMKQFDEVINFDNVYLAKGEGPNGDEFADALSGTALASETSSPVLLTNNNIDSNINQYVKSKLKLETKVIALGGTAVVPDTLIKFLMDEKGTVPVAKVYNSTGTYSDGAVNGSATISASGIYLKNTVINGDLLIASTVNDGDVDLDNVTVTGKIIVNGGGSHSIHIHNGSVNDVLVDRPLGEGVRLVMDENSSVNSITLESSGIIDESKAAKPGKITVLHNVNLNLIGNFDIVKIMGRNSNVKIENGGAAALIVDNLAKDSVVNIDKDSTVKDISVNSDTTISGEGQIASLSVEAPNINILLDANTVSSLNIANVAQGSSVNIGTDSNVNTLTANAQANIEGQGVIGTAVINVNGVVLEQKPASVNINDGISATINGTVQTGSSSSSGSNGGSQGGTTGSTTQTGTSSSGGSSSSGSSGSSSSGSTGSSSSGSTGSSSSGSTGSSSSGSSGSTTSPSTIITGVAPLQDIYAPQGVDESNIFAADLFPKTVQITLSNNTTTTVSIVWIGYDSLTINPPGVNTYDGLIPVPQGVKNPNHLLAKVNVHFGSAQVQVINISSVKPINTIYAPEGTTDVAAMLPQNVELTLSDNTTSTAAVVWDGGSPYYNGNVDRIYTFTGSITLPQGVSNSGNINAIAYVSVGPNKLFSNIQMPFDELKDSQGNTYIKDTWNEQVVEFDKYGNMVRNLTGVTAGSTIHFSNIGDIALDSLDNVYIVDKGNKRIFENDSNGNVVRIISGGSLALNEITEIAVDSLRNLYVADAYDKKIVEFDVNGKVVRTLVGTDTNNPFDIALAMKLDKNDNLYVADRFNHRIVEFDNGGNVVRVLTGYNNIPFSLPNNVANELITDDSGNIYIIDKGNKRVDEFSSDGSFVREITGSDATHQFGSIVGAALDNSGNIYIAGDTFSVTEFDNNGSFVRNITGTGIGIAPNNTFSDITNITVDNSGNLYVADYANNLTSEFDPSGKLIKTWGRLVDTVAPAADLHVPLGTTINLINLPQYVNANFQGADSISVPVIWNLSSGNYNEKVLGTYTLTGKIVTPTVMPNVGKNASINIIVDPVTK